MNPTDKLIHDVAVRVLEKTAEYAPMQKTANIFVEMLANLRDMLGHGVLAGATGGVTVPAQLGSYMAAIQDGVPGNAANAIGSSAVGALGGIVPGIMGAAGGGLAAGALEPRAAGAGATLGGLGGFVGGSALSGHNLRHAMDAATMAAGQQHA